MTLSLDGLLLLTDGDGLGVDELLELVLGGDELGVLDVGGLENSHVLRQITTCSSSVRNHVFVRNFINIEDLVPVGEWCSKRGRRERR